MCQARLWKGQRFPATLSGRLCPWQAFQRVRTALWEAKSSRREEDFTSMQLISDALVKNGGVVATHPLGF